MYEIRFGMARAELVIFDTLDQKLLRRVGWLSFIQPYAEGQHISRQFLQPPLTTITFFKKQFPIPNNNIEIQKLFYPDDWWIEVRPPGC